VSTIIYTSVDRDGMLAGADLDTVRTVASALRGELIYAGGIGSLDDLRALAQLDSPRLTAVVIGKALYEARFTLAEASAALCT